MQTYDTYSFGCRVNQAEMEALSSILESRGMVRNIENPELYVINTCSVTHKAERETRQLINQIRLRWPEVYLVITGCAATNWIKLKKTIPHVSLLIDNHQKEYIADIVHKRSTLDSPVSLRSKPVLPHDPLTRSGRIMIKIQDGCQRFCSFCIVPYLRGTPRSASIYDLIGTVNSAVESGISEVIYAAINTEAFGHDTGESLYNLISQTLESTSIKRLSFGSIHPWSINDAFFKLYRSYSRSDRLVHFFHIPLQSGSDSVLTRMKRGYTRGDFLEKLHMINRLNEHVFLATDIIVGYLEETDAEFEESYEFLLKSPLSKFHVFRFSPRQHTAAYYLSKRLNIPSVDIAQKRSAALRDLSQKKYGAFQMRQIGRVAQALMLERRTESYQHALFENQLPLLVKCDHKDPGTIAHVRVENCIKGNLIASLV